MKDCVFLCSGVGGKGLQQNRLQGGGWVGNMGGSGSGGCSRERERGEVP